MRRQKVLDFIKIFQSKNNLELFTEVSCYWFAFILASRFNGDLVYNPDSCHFATRIGTTLYDITGEIKYPEDYLEWDDSLDTDGMISENCILLV